MEKQAFLDTAWCPGMKANYMGVECEITAVDFESKQIELLTNTGYVWIDYDEIKVINRPRSD